MILVVGALGLVVNLLGLLLFAEHGHSHGGAGGGHGHSHGGPTGKNLYLNMKKIIVFIIQLQALTILGKIQTKF